ncbi:3' exoribonuclease [Colletotrichum karsti]|uniref:3' exoribonuclease n=1 Tax=Colletotrichum karsti TaxID=1095194 RepID=A0A9P6LCL9_9PEZI|nr:3' exoribonuclease [Colletotrichum karsti]KAF9869219.1 3' exoribonuclease [Colletotrichum karsti]
MADRRRINGPPGATLPPVYEVSGSKQSRRARPPNGIRGLFLKTGITPTASGSAYMEIETPEGHANARSKINGMKLICTVHGPRSLPRSAPFSPYLVLSTHVKYAPFATRQRRGYLRDSSERDLSVHLDTALRGVIIADRWPKSGVDVIVTVIEGDQEREASHAQGNEEWDMMNVLSGCITVAAAALADAGIDCVDMVTGGVAALVNGDDTDPSAPSIVLDPVSIEHERILAACCVAYLPSRAEITNLWVKGQLPPSDPLLHTKLVGRAIQASKGSYRAVLERLQDNQPPYS